MCVCFLYANMETLPNQYVVIMSQTTGLLRKSEGGRRRDEGERGERGEERKDSLNE